MKNVLIIGANSYIGKSFKRYVETNSIDDLAIHLISGSSGEWKQVEFSNYDSVLLLSGIVHQKETKYMEELYDRVNHRMAVEIAQKAKESNVKQFVFMSTAAVFGSKVTCITKDTIPNPTTLYGKSKLAAEKDIMKLQEDSFKVAIVRPPMVYGEGCKGNYPRLVKLAKMTPIFPDYHNKRSMIHIDGLCVKLYELIINENCGYYHPQDEAYVDTCELVVKIRREMGKNTWLVGGFNFIIRFLRSDIIILNKLFQDYYYELKV